MPKCALQCQINYNPYTKNNNNYKKILKIYYNLYIKNNKYPRIDEIKNESLKICLSKKIGLKLSFKDGDRCAALNLKWQRVPEIRRTH